MVAPIPLHHPHLVPLYICCEYSLLECSFLIFNEAVQVEHETSVIGSKIITVVLLLATGLVYLTFRHRISQAFG